MFSSRLSCNLKGAFLVVWVWGFFKNILNHLYLWDVLVLPVNYTVTVLCPSLKGEEPIKIILKTRKVLVQYVTHITKCFMVFKAYFLLNIF